MVPFRYNRIFLGSLEDSRVDRAHHATDFRQHRPAAIAYPQDHDARFAPSGFLRWVFQSPVAADYVGVFKKETVGSSDLDPPGSRSVTIRCGIVAEMHELFLVAFGDAHQHHEKCQAIPGPPAEPADPPLAEARVDRDWSFQAQESGLEAHACAIHGSASAHSQGIGRTKPPSK